MLRVAVPNKGTLSESAAEILTEAGYRRRTDSRDLTVLDPANQVEFFFLRPKDIAIYVGSGELDLGITGRDLALDSGAPVDERLALGFGRSTFRYAAPAGKDWHSRGSLRQAHRDVVPEPRARRPGQARHPGRGHPARRRGGDLDPARRRRRDRRRRRLRADAAPARPGRVRRLAVRLGGGADRAARRRPARQGPQPAGRAHPGCRVRAAVPDAGLRLPALAAGPAPC